MNIEYFSSFDVSFKKLHASLQKKVKHTISKLLQSLISGKRSQGIGLRKLRRSIWEARCGLDYRILFELSEGTISFIIVGTHDDVSRFLKR